MKHILFALALLLGGTQAPSEPYPGQGLHTMPPDGWYCEHQNMELSVPVAHTCACEQAKDAQGNVVEDKSCTVWCYADHCHCKSMGTHDPENPFERQEQER